jgi:hypothetical protein
MKLGMEKVMASYSIGDAEEKVSELERAVESSSASFEALKMSGNLSDAVESLVADTHLKKSIHDLRFSEIMEKVIKLNVMRGVGLLIHGLALILSVVVPCSVGLCLSISILQALLFATVYVIRSGRLMPSLPRYSPPRKPQIHKVDVIPANQGQDVYYTMPVIVAPRTLSYEEYTWTTHHGEICVRNPARLGHSMDLGDVSLEEKDIYAALVQWSSRVKNMVSLSIMPNTQLPPLDYDQWLLDETKLYSDYIDSIKKQLEETSERVKHEWNVKMSHWNQVKQSYDKTYEMESDRVASKAIGIINDSNRALTVIMIASSLLTLISIILSAICSGLIVCGISGVTSVVIILRFKYLKAADKLVITISRKVYSIGPEKAPDLNVSW